MKFAHGILDNPDVMFEGVLGMFFTWIDFAVGNFCACRREPEYFDRFREFIFEGEVGFGSLPGAGFWDFLDG